MSADRQRLTSAIRKIANTDPEKRDSLNDGDSKGAKPGAAGVGSSSEAQGDRVCCDGSTGSANPGVDERDPDSDGAGQDGLNADDPANLDVGDGTLSGVTDCATGEPICFDGDGFIPPDGWDAPDDPPQEDFYNPLYYYRYINRTDGSVLIETNSCVEAASQYNSDFEEFCGTTPIPLSQRCDSTTTGTIGAFDCYGVNRRLERIACSSSYSSACADPPPTADSWPTDGCVNLAVKGGAIVGSKYDPDQDGSYSAPRDSIDLCSGDDQISLSPAADGGYKTINPTTDNGYLYNNKNERIAHIDGNEYSDPAV